MRTKKLGVLIGLIAMLAIVAATTMAVAMPSAQGAAAPKKEAVLQFSIIIGDPDFDLLRVVPIIREAAKIGSPDRGGFSVDSFFDITYRIDTTSSTPSQTVDIEIHATPNSPDVDPAAIINNVKKEMDKGVPPKKQYTGHVTVLK